MRTEDPDRYGATAMAIPMRKTRSAPSLYVWKIRLRYREPVTRGRARPGGMRGRKFEMSE